MGATVDIQATVVGSIQIRVDADIVEARRRLRELADSLSYSATELAMLATAVSEVARNVLEYAGHGEVDLSQVKRGARVGIRIIARDDGPGIADIGLAMQDGYSSQRGLGLGLPGSRRLVDEFEVESALGHGTTVTLIKWGPVQ